MKSSDRNKKYLKKSLANNVHYGILIMENKKDKENHMRKIERELRSIGIKPLGKVTAKEKMLIVEKVARKLASLKHRIKL